MKTKFIWAIMILLFVLAVVYWFLFRPVQVKTEAAEYGSVAVFVYASGQVIPEEKVVVRSKNPARIEKILVLEGQKVQLGQPIVLLENSETTAQYELAVAEQSQKEADYAFALREKTRYEQLLQSEAVARRDYDQIATQAEGARLQVLRAQANSLAFFAKKDDMTMLSPFDGTVLEKILDAGTAVGTNDGILVLAKQGKMQVEGKVDELDAAKIAVGQKVLLTFDSFGGQVYQGKVATLAPRIDNATKSFKIKVDVLEDIVIQPGMSAELNILQSEKKRALLIPVSALAGDQVFIVKNGRAASQTVIAGIRDSKKVEIIAGIEQGEAVIMNPTDIKEGTLVVVTK